MSIPNTMKAVVIKETGTAQEALTFDPSYPVPPTLKPNTVLVKNEYSGLNFIDTYHRSGLYKRNLPFILGTEGGGIIAAIHKNNNNVDDVDLNVGDRVIYMGTETYCEYTSVSIDKIVKIPDNVSMEVAIACMCQGLTAHYLVTCATGGLVKKGDWCLVYSAGSGTGQWTAQMAKIQGYKVIATTSKGKEEMVRASGVNYDELIVLDTSSSSSSLNDGTSYGVYNHDMLVSRIMEITQGKGVTCVMDGVGKATADISIDVLAPRGIFISYGNASGAVPQFPLLRLVAKSLFVTRPKLGDYIASRKELMARANDVFGWLESGKLKVQIDKIFTLEEAKEAHEFIESGKSKGKILLKI